MDKKLLISIIQKQLFETLIKSDDSIWSRNNNNFNKGREKKEQSSELFFNEDDKIKKGYNPVYLNEKRIAFFSIQKIGEIPIDPQHRFEKGKYDYKKNVDRSISFPNSIYFDGGFIVEERNSGIGRAIIKKIFNDNSNIDNIFLYAIDWQGGVEFWHKIGGIDLLYNQENGLRYIQVNKNNIK